MHTVSDLVDAHSMTSVTYPVANTTLATSHCPIMQFGEYIPWNNPENIVSFETEEIVFTLMVLLFTPVFFLIACPANIINMIVFYKHGLKERINVCLFALSLADEVYMIVNMVWYSDQFLLRFTTKERFGPVVTFMVNNRLTIFHGFIWVSQVLSAIIAIERCFCVMQPLRSQTVLRTSTMIAIVIGVHVVVLSLEFFEMFRYEVICATDPLTKRKTVLVTSSEIYYRHQELMDFLHIFVMGIGLPGFVMIVVIVTTTITTAKLRQAALWRAETSSHSGVSERDVAVTKMLVVNSIFFIICLMPFVVFRFAFLFMPGVYAGGRKHNFYFMIYEILFVISYINATFNFVIYYVMGSRYRQTFWQLFGKCAKKNKNVSQMKTNGLN